MNEPQPRQVTCTECGKPVEYVRECYAIPVCYACLPPPPPMKTICPKCGVSHICQFASDDYCDSPDCYPYDKSCDVYKHALYRRDWGERGTARNKYEEYGR